MVAGLTGSGKTTISKELASLMNVEYVSGSALRAEYYGVRHLEDHHDRRLFWSTDDRALSAERKRIMQRGVERALDLAILERYRQVATGVFDVWFLPWLTPASPGISIRLDVALPARCNRLGQSMIGTSEDFSRFAESVTSKDEASRQYGLHEYGFDIYDDAPFDVVISPTVNCKPSDVAGAIISSWRMLRLNMGDARTLPTIVRRPSTDDA